MSIAPTLETERLILRPFAPTDLAPMHRIFSDAKAMRFMPSLPHTTEAETLAQLGQSIGRAGAKYWSICLKENGEMIGHVHFLGETRLPGMGYIIHPEHWGNGYVPEACRAALDYGFAELGHDRVELWINEFNVASQRVAQKLGFKLKGQINQRYPHEENHHVMLVYGMLADTWQNKPPITAPRTPFFSVEPVLMVHDILKAAAFYRDKLGFTIDFIYGDPADHAGVSRGEWTGSMVTIQLSRVPEDRALDHAGYLYILVDSSLDQLHEQYKANGVTIEREPTSYPWGMREFVVRDIYGHRLIFATHG